MKRKELEDLKKKVVDRLEGKKKIKQRYDRPGWYYELLENGNQKNSNT